MKKELKQKFPEWCNSDKKFYLCLTDDADSFLSCKLLEKIKGYEIKYFYDFRNLYRAQGTDTRTKCIGVDMGLMNGRCWDNHYGSMSNKKSANPNTILQIPKNRYCEKYPLSTLLLLYSFYDVPLPKTELGRMILLAIDGSYIGFYSKKKYFRDIYINWLNLLELEELEETLKRNNPQNFEEVIKKYGLKEKIYIKDKKISLPWRGGFNNNMYLNLNKIHFDLMQKYKISQNEHYVNNKNIFTLAWTYKNKVQYSYKIS